MANVMGRFRLTDSLLPPAQCLLCRRPESVRGFADTGISDDWLGAFYLCGQCVLELAELFGAMAPEAAAELVAKVADLIAQRDRLTEQLLALGRVQEAALAVVATVGGVADEPTGDGGGGAAGGATGSADARGGAGGGSRGGKSANGRSRT